MPSEKGGEDFLPLAVSRRVEAAVSSWLREGGGGGGGGRGGGREVDLMTGSSFVQGVERVWDSSPLPQTCPEIGGQIAGRQTQA